MLPVVSAAHLLPAVALALALAAPGCRGRPPASPPPSVPVTDPAAVDAVIARNAGPLMALPGVVGVYRAERPDGTPCITVMVVRADPALARRIPSRLEGVPVVIEETGEIRPR